MIWIDGSNWLLMMVVHHPMVCFSFEISKVRTSIGSQKNKWVRRLWIFNRGGVLVLHQRLSVSEVFLLCKLSTIGAV